ncbi:MAG: pectate lyase, partial [Bacteroidales bacterium]|nr:pectate lyase [Bacteroidales bacterium]
MNYHIRKTGLTFLISVLIALNAIAQKMDHSWEQIVMSDDTAWFGTHEAKQIADNVLLFQRNIGGWPKNTAMYKTLTDKQKEDLLKLKSSTKGCTIDNGATYMEMTFLSKVYRQQPDEKYKNAFLAGLNYILEAQYDNGGWPQFYPLRKGYYSHITFNDDAMVNILKVLREIADESGYYSIKVPKE